MKKYMRLAILALIIACLAGCSSKSGEGTADVSPAAQTAQGQDTAETADETTPAPTSAPLPTLTPDEMIGDLSLKEMFAEHNIKVGTCLNEQYIKDAAISKLVLSQFNSFTMENSMKPDSTFDKAASIASGEIKYKLPADAIKMLDWARENGMAVRGHTIVWYSQTPDWIFYNDFDKTKGLVTREVMLERLESAIRNTFGVLEELGYSDLFYAFDVVNEYWMENGSMRQNHWTETIGEDYVWYALYYARQYAPDNIDLYINDYNEQYKKTVGSFLDTLVDEDGNYLMDGIGFQAHLYTSDSLPVYLSTVDLIASKGLKVEITELDVELGAYQKPLIANDDNLRLQGRFYYNLINGLLERVDDGRLKMDSITVWGINDKMSWRSSYNPLLFNKKGEPKYAYFGMIQAKDRAGF